MNKYLLFRLYQRLQENLNILGLIVFKPSHSDKKLWDIVHCLNNNGELFRVEANQQNDLNINLVAQRHAASIPENLSNELKIILPELFPHSPKNYVCYSQLDPSDKDNIVVTIVEGENSELLTMLIEELVLNTFLENQLEQQAKVYEAYLEEVKTIKEKLLPQSNHIVEGLEYAVHYKANVGGGGDYYDIMDLRDARKRGGELDPPISWGIGLVDVSGHGPGAAVEVAMIDAILRTYQGNIESGPAHVVSYINQHFFTRQLRGGFVTGVLCSYNSASKTFYYASAGHLPIIIKRKNGAVEVLENNDGIPIGVEREFDWKEQEVTLDSGDLIILMTDGITEALSLQQEQFSFEKLIEILKDSDHSNPDPLLEEILDVFNVHTGGADEQDDQTLVILKINH